MYCFCIIMLQNFSAINAINDNQIIKLQFVLSCM